MILMMDINHVPSFMLLSKSAQIKCLGALLVISNASGIADIFEAISRHQLWDYTHCSPIMEISEKFGGDDPELTEWKDYKLELAGFYATSKIVDYITVLKSEEEIAEPEESL